jgi:hypothetical protein
MLSKKQIADTITYLHIEGGFATKLQAAWYEADSVNKERIETAFADLLETTYRKWVAEMSV